QNRQRPIELPREEVLAVLLRRLFNNAVRQIQDRLGAAVILFQLIDGSSGKERWELHDVLERRTSETIDRLRVVADDHHVLMGGYEMPDDIRLQTIGVLILIHQNVPIQGR